MPQYLISAWHDDTYETDFSTPDAQRRVAQVGAFNEELDVFDHRAAIDTQQPTP